MLFQHTKIYLLFLLVALNISIIKTELAFASVNGDCVSDSSYDLDYKENYYCGAITTWNITKADFYSQDNHREALKRYQGLYRVWMEKENTDGKEDCLGIGWYFFCATAIPYCDPSTQISYPDVTCTSACDLFKYRCPDETTIYTTYCSGDSKTSSKCAFSKLNMLRALSFLFMN